MKPGTLLAVIVFVLIAVAHLLRLAWGARVIVGTTEIPLWVSWVAVVMPLALACLLVREQRTVRNHQGLGVMKRNRAIK